MRKILAPVITIVLVAAACGGGGGSGGTAQPSTTEAETVTDGGTLVAAISSDPGSLNPAITTSGAVHTASELIFNGLVELDAKGNPVPALADAWKVEEGGKVYRFDLADGVTWHDGRPFTSADVKFSFEEVLLKFHSRTSASVGQALDRIEAPDDDTVVFRFKQPYAPLLQQLGVTEAPIVPKHVYEGTDPQTNPANKAPIGTGPFKFASYTPDSEVRLVRNTDYFKADLPHLDEVVLQVIPDDGNAVAALERGEVDFVFGAPGPELSRLKADNRFETLETADNPGGSNCIMTVSFNLDKPLFADVRTRRGLGTALDRSQFLERVQFGEGKVAEAPISSGIPWAHAKGVTLPRFDQEAAGKLLDEAGWTRQGDGVRTAQGVEGVADGTKLAFDFLVFPRFVPYGELFKAQLAQVGAEVTLRPLEPPVFADAVFKNRDFDTNVISYCNGPDPEIGVRRMYISSNIKPIPFSNSSAYRNDAVDALFDKALTTPERRERTKIYAQIQAQLAEDLPYLWLVETTSTRVFTARCRQFQPAGHFAETAYCKKT